MAGSATHNKFHHGYLLVGDRSRGREKALDMISQILEVDKEQLLSHPDFSFIQKPTLSINDARKIREDSSRKSLLGKGRVFLMEIDSMTREAGNALLKILEEPAGKNYFFITLPNTENFLDTLRSRMMFLDLGKTRDFTAAKIDFVKRFLKSSPEKRIEMIAPLEEKKEKILAFFDCLESVLLEILESGFSPQVVDSLEILIKQRTFAGRRNSSPKMILQYLSFVLPQL